MSGFFLGEEFEFFKKTSSSSEMELIERLELFVSFDGEREIFNFSFPFVSEVELESARDRDSRFSSASRRVFFDGFGGAVSSSSFQSFINCPFACLYCLKISVELVIASTIFSFLLSQSGASRERLSTCSSSQHNFV